MAKYLVTNSIFDHTWYPFCQQCSRMPSSGDVYYEEKGRILCRGCGWTFSKENSKHIMRNSVSFESVRNQDYPNEFNPNPNPLIDAWNKLTDDEKCEFYDTMNKDIEEIKFWETHKIVGEPEKGRSFIVPIQEFEVEND